MSTTREAWHNWYYDRQVFKPVGWVPATDDEARQYIPQDSQAQQKYGELRAQGLSILDAILETFEELTQ